MSASEGTKEDESRQRKKGSDLKELLLETITEPTIFKEDGTVVPPKHKEWTALSAKVEVMSAKYIWQFLYRNRHGVTTALRKQFGINCKEDDILQDNPDSPDDETVERPKVTVLITIPSKTWEVIKPVPSEYAREDRPCKKRTIWTMPPFNWCSCLHNLFWEQHNIPCAKTFRRAIVSPSPDSIRKYITFDEGMCTDCKGTGEAWIDTKPAEGQPVKLTLRFTDSRGKQHKTKKQCRGDERKQLGKTVRAMGCEEFRRKDAQSKMHGKTNSATLYSSYVLRKISQEGRKAELEELKIPTGDQFSSLRQMKYSHPYLGSIHFVCEDPVLVFYHAPIQVQVHNDICKRGYAVMTIDATGGVTERISRPACRSAHIFLYQIVGNQGTVTVPLNQMISEKQNANTILYWLNESLRNDFLVPNEFVCDESPALLSALCRSFGGSSSTENYKSKCFDFLSGKLKSLPKCFIRNDIAHFMKNASHWKIWANVANPLVKEHFLRWLGLLVQCLSLDEFQNILLHLLIISQSETESNCVTTSKEFLIQCTCTLEVLQEQDFLSTCEDEDEYIEEEDDATPENIGNFLSQVAEKSKQKATRKGCHPNPYYLPSFSEKVLKKAASFIFWSSVMAKKFNSPNVTGTSAHSEGYFSDLKNNVFKTVKLPIPMNHFVGMHLHSIFGQGLLASSELSSNNNDVDVTNKKSVNRESLEIEELHQVENWRGRGNAKRRPSKYLSKHPEMAIEVQMKELKSPADVLLRNGNLTGFPFTSNDSKIQVRNTCSFDAFIQLLAQNIIENQKFRQWADSVRSNSKSMNVAWHLAHDGATSDTYALRAEALIPHSRLMGANVSSSTRTKKVSTVSVLVYDLWGNVINLIRDLNLELYSIHNRWVCENRHKEEATSIFLQINEEVLAHQGIGKLVDAVSVHLREDEKKCCAPSCNKTMLPKGKLSDTIMIDLSFFEQLKTADRRKVLLSDIPCNLSLQNNEYNIVGVVGYQPNHYVSYGRRLKGYWELYNDISKHPYRTNESCSLQPVILVYSKW